MLDSTTPQNQGYSGSVQPPQRQCHSVVRSHVYVTPKVPEFFLVHTGDHEHQEILALVKDRHLFFPRHRGGAMLPCHASVPAAESILKKSTA